MQQRGCQHRTRQKGLIEQAMPGPCRQAAARPGLGEAQGLHRVGNSCSEAEGRHMGGTWETHQGSGLRRRVGNAKKSVCFK